MSTTYRFPTLDYEDLRSPTIDDEYSFQNIRSNEEEPVGQESGFGTREQSDNSRQVFEILAENRRLQRENESLRHCLILTKEHCDLKTANYVTSALVWCDDRLRQNYNDFSVFKTTQNPGLSTVSSAFKPVTPKSKNTSQQTRSPNEKLYAEDWSIRAASPKPRKIYAEDWVERNASLLNKSMPDSQPWHMTLRKYDTPLGVPRPKSGNKSKPKSASYAGGRTPGKSGKTKRSAIPLPVQRLTEVDSSDYELSRQGSFGFDTQSSAQPPSPRTVLFAGDKYGKARNSPRRSPPPRPNQQPRRSTLPRRSPSPHRSPSPTGRQSPLPRRGRSPSPERNTTGRHSPSPAFEREQPMESGMYTMMHTGRRSPSPTGQPSYTIRQSPYSSSVSRRSPSPAGRVSPSPAGRNASPPPGRPLPFSVGQQSPSTPGRVSPTPGGRRTPPPTDRQSSFSAGRQSPSPVGRVSPDGRYNPPPAGRPVPFATGRQSPSPTGRVSPTPSGRYSPPPTERPLPFTTERQSSLPFGLPLSPNGRLTPGLSPATVRRQTPPPSRVPHQQSPATRGRSPVMSFVSPVDPLVPNESLVDKAIRSQLTFDSSTVRATSPVRHALSVRSASTPPGPRPATPLSLRASSPWSMLSDSHPVIDQMPTSRSPGAVTLTRSPTPRSPSPGKLRQGSPKLLGIDPLKPKPLFTEQKFRSRSVDRHGAPLSPAYGSPRNNDMSEGYGSHSFTSPSGGSRNYDAIGQPVAASTPVSRNEKRDRSPKRNTPAATSFTNDHDSYRQPASNDYDSYRQPAPNDYDSYRQPAETFQEDSLAQLLGINGHGAGEKARGVVYRPVDTLTGYRPNLTPDVKFNLSQVKHNKRIVGEIAFQLDRRILEYVFAANRSRKKNARYYGYSLTNIMQMIYKESAKAGFHNPRVELDLRTRLDNILRKLGPFGYNLDTHAEKSQDMVNKYGLLNGPPDQNTVRGFGLDDPAVLRVVMSKVIRDENELHDMLIMLDCLCYLSYEDGEPMFMW